MATTCEHCGGEGWVWRILNPKWPSGDLPHREKACCPACNGYGYVTDESGEAAFPPPPEDPDEDRAYQAYSDRQVNGEAR